MSEEALALYADMGATPVINAIGNRTFLGGSAPDPEVVAAMQLAGRYYVDMDAFLESTGGLVADLIDMVVGRTAITFRTLELWSKRAARVVLRERDAIRSRYYLRLSVEDRPGVLADIAGVLGKNKISISSVIQHEPDKEAEESKVPLVIMTHLAASGALQSALSAFDKLQCVRDDCVTMQVLD